MSAEPSSAGPPLAGLRIVDLTTFLSGPFCAQILGDLGAEIVKIEPFAGDSSRTIPPHFVGDDSLYYLSTNRNKRSIALDLKTQDGQRVARELIARSDAVIENFRPGVCAKLGLCARTLRAADPRLIWASISGFGQTGPWRDLPAYDMIVQALSGVMSITGEPGRDAVRLGIPGGDLIAGMYAAIAILAAVSDRARTGEGRTIDVSMLDGQLSMLSYQATYALNAGVHPQPQAARHDSIPTYRSFRGGDGRELVVTANTERMWVALCEVLGRAELATDARFADAGRRLAARDALWPLLEEAFCARPAGEWVAALSARGVPAALIKTVPEAIADARVGEREMIVEVAGASGDRVELIGNPIRMSGTPVDHRYPPPLSGDAEALLTDLLGLGPAEIDALVAAGALLPARAAS